MNTRVGLMAAILVAATSLVPSHGGACPANTNGPTAFYVASDGVLQFIYRCNLGSECSATNLPPFHVEDDAEITLPGTILASGVVPGPLAGMWFAWQPQKPFAAGTTYVVKPDAAGSTDRNGSFQLGIPSVDPTKLALSLNAEIFASDLDDETVCCDSIERSGTCTPPGPPSGKPITLCFPTHQQQHVSLTVQDPTNSRLEAPFQFLYETTFSSGANTQREPALGAALASAVVDWTGTQYCFSTDAIDPRTGARTHAADGCKDFNVPTLSTVPTPDTLISEVLWQCTKPPAGYEDAWKRAVAATLGGVPLGSDAGVASASSDATDAGDVEAPHHDGSGCSLGADASGGPLLAALLMLLRKRRRR